MSGADQIDTAATQSNTQPVLTNADAHDSSHSQAPAQTPPVKQMKAICRFYGTKRGCRAGSSCPFRHVLKQAQQSSAGHDLTNSPSPQTEVEATESAPTPTSITENKPAPTSPEINTRQPVPKPISAQQKTNPREFQINQVVRRFTPTRTEDNNGNTTLSFSLAPSDPDFPFEIVALKCSLIIPVTWPKLVTRPSLKVQNTEIPRGYQINVERGFDTLVNTGKTLLTLLNDLDRNLERFLSSEKAQTIKIVANRPKQEASPAPFSRPVQKPVSADIPTLPSSPSWTSQQKRDAASKRDADIGQLESRMGRLASFQKARMQQDYSFTIPVTIPKPGRLPLSLQSLKEVILFVPQLYNLESCSIQLKGVTGPEVKAVETNFAQHARENHEMTLMAHVNHLIQHLHEMVVVAASKAEPASESSNTDFTSANMDPDLSDHDIEGRVDQDRPHLVFLSQPPPEWSHLKIDDHSSSESDSEGYDSFEDSGDNTENEIQGGASLPTTSIQSSLEKGILISFPQLEMTGMELLELRILSISVKCDRCKQSHEIKLIKPAETEGGTSIRTETCNKCNSLLSASYKPDLIHANSIKAGTLNLEGCTINDMLPSTFIATCSECSTTQSPTAGIITVRGDVALSICRTCHQKMTLKLSDVKFLLVSTSDRRLHTGLPPRRRKKEDLGITSGTELPLRGRCPHYAKSYRWFRFSCCNRVYPCDRCHDATEEHPNEHANRMICGFCSREQNYRPEDCHFCGRSVVRKAGGGFWEGGKGTRDKVKMSRKDPRKYKRIGTSGGAEKK